MTAKSLPLILKMVPAVLAVSFLIVIVVTGLLVWSLLSPIKAGDGANRYVEFLQKGMQLRVLQVVNGIVLGFACVYLGVAMCWEGVLGSFELEASNDQGRVTFKSAGAGALVVLAGAALLYVGTSSRGVEMTAPTSITTGEESTNGKRTTTIQVPESISF
jgi:hypothetical protein